MTQNSFGAGRGSRMSVLTGRRAMPTSDDPGALGRAEGDAEPGVSDQARGAAEAAGTTPHLRSTLMASGAIARAQHPHPKEVPMTEPTTSAAGGVAAWKLAGGILGIGIVASALGFLVLLPRTAKEAALRAGATMAGSALIGPFLVAAAYSRWPELFGSGVKLASVMGLEPWFGLFMVGAPLLALGGLPCWWILGAAVLWLERRRGKDLGELARDARADAASVVAIGAAATTSSTAKEPTP